MTLPSSGALSMSAINAEFGRGNNLNSYRGTIWYTDAGSSGTFPTGAISFSDFYGKRATSPTFSFTISANQTNANLRTLAVNAGWNQSSAVVATIASGVYVSSNSTGTPGLTINGSFPGGVSLVNNGYIVGMGGNGGNNGGSSGAGVAGASGGLALSAQISASITNNGTIAGGGGGGGGGGAGAQYVGKGAVSCGGGGGGGGRSSNAANSIGGTAYTSTTGDTAQSGSSGIVSSAGSGGAGGSSSFWGVPKVGGNGGGGGGWGSSGASGASGSGNYGAGNRSGGSGGSGGGAVSGNSYITWVATGTRLGSIT